MGFLKFALPSDIPWLESIAARIGVAALVGWSGYVGFTFWWSREEPLFAFLTIAAELIAFAGLGVARHHWAEDRRFAWGAAALTLFAAGWCGLTMYEKIAADAHTRAVAAAKETLPYTLAATDLDTASQSLRQKLAESPPLGLGPKAITAWAGSQAQAVASLTAARDDAQRRLEAATPKAETDWLAMVRGLAIEIIKLFGFLFFRVKASGDFRALKAALGIGVATVTAAAPAFADPPPVSRPVESFSQPPPPSATPPATFQPVAETAAETFSHLDGSLEDKAIYWLKAGEAVRAVSRATGLSRYRVGLLAEANGLLPLIRPATGRKLAEAGKFKVEGAAA